MSGAPREGLEASLAATLRELRRRRRFDAEPYVQGKVALLNAYLARAGLRACAVGVSGGIDSAVTLALLQRAARAPGSPLERAVAVLMPLFLRHGATHQDVALARGREVAQTLGAQAFTVDLSAAHEAVLRAVEVGSGVESSPWAAGQLASTIRTPALYHVVTLLTQQGLPALVVGTTNRDEGSYLGFFGKASDGMVDLQLISDLHKSEVFAVARHLGVPASVLDATPTGDTFDGRPDEVMIGAPYDFVELTTALRCLPEREQQALRAGWSEAGAAQFARWQQAVEALHRVNAHKYLVGSPAVHLDVLPRAVPGGWSEEPPSRPPRPPDHRAFVAEFTMPEGLVERLAAHPGGALVAASLPGLGASALLVDGVLDGDECEALAALILSRPQAPTDRHGRADGFDARREAPASWRCSCFDHELAAVLWGRLAPALPCVRVMDALTPTDHLEHGVWRPVGVSPLMRWLRYERGGWLVPHHDAAFDPGDGVHRTLMSVLLYLGSASEQDGGATRFLLDPQRHLPLSRRDFRDAQAPPHERDVLARVQPRRGAALLFDHRLPHDAEAWRADHARLVLRTDLIFACCGPAAMRPAEPPRRGVSRWRWSGAAPAGLWPFERHLGVRAGAPRAVVDEAYRTARASLPPDADPGPLRLAWKALRDPFYRDLYGPLGSLEALEEAGFFDDGGDAEGEDPRADPGWMVTPLHPLLDALARGPVDDPRWLAVLVTTGAFCPVHAGHVRMMEAAREVLERQGAHVLGGYLSPSHDRYVQAKCGADNPGAAARVALCEEAVRAHPWLEVDPWEALHCDVPVNFTEVIERLGAYLSRHLRTARPVEVVYVFGGDNARFSLSFLVRGRAVCVPRPGHDEAALRYQRHPALRGNSRVAFAAPGDGVEASSSAIRRGDLRMLPASVAAAWGGRGGSSPARRFFLRDDGAWATASWREGRAAQIAAAWEIFWNNLVEALRRAGSGPVERLDLDEQRRRVSDATQGARVVSLDACLGGWFELGLSRRFPVASGVAGGEVVARPGWPALPEQARRLADARRASGEAPAGEVIVLDDDVVSGATLAVAAGLVGEARVRALTALEQVATPGPGEPWELADARDFLLGAREGGLVVALPDGSTARAPYVLPCVRPARRLSLPGASEVGFSRDIWNINIEYFTSIRPALLVADASPALRTLARYLGFDEQTPLEEVCRWHAARLAAATRA